MHRLGDLVAKQLDIRVSIEKPSNGSKQRSVGCAPRLKVLSQTFSDGRTSVELISSLPRQLGELLKRTESGCELTFADNVDQFYACQDRCG